MLINYAISLQLIWSINCFLVGDTAASQVPIFKIIDTNLFVPVITLSTQDNVKLLKLFESGFEKTANWNKYQSKKTNQT